MSKYVQPALRAIFLALAAFAGLAALPAQARGNDSSASVDYQAEQQQLVYVGRISPDFDTAIATALAAHPEARSLLISSLGGNLNPALQAAKLLNARGISVRASGHCASACAMLWAAAMNRQLEDGATIGLHSSRPAQPLPPALAKALGGFVGEQKTQLLAQAGFPTRVIDKALATPASKMYWLKAKELVRLGVNCAVVNDTHLSI